MSPRGIFPKKTKLSHWNICSSIFISTIHKTQHLELAYSFISG